MCEQDDDHQSEDHQQEWKAETYGHGLIAGGETGRDSDGVAYGIVLVSGSQCFDAFSLASEALQCPARRQLLQADVWVISTVRRRPVCCSTIPVCLILSPIL